MSIAPKQSAVTVTQLQQRKQVGQPVTQPITAITCYDYCTAMTLDTIEGLDLVLVGDSLAMTVLGHPNTLSLTLDEMLHHVKAVTNGCKRALVVADMPFMTYQVDIESAIRNAGRLVQEGHAGAVKLEGASTLVLETTRRLVELGIPVMGHLGFTPQSVNTLGGFKVQGKTTPQANWLLQQAEALSQAGAFAIVLEMVPEAVATHISQTISTPTIGIGAGAGCDGQILVIDDLLGRYPTFTPKFVRQYAQLGQATATAVAGYVKDVRDRVFPNASESFESIAF
jgi:3-methyl-2-oxobutanoate hydroxymethyltransferase